MSEDICGNFVGRYCGIFLGGNIRSFTASPHSITAKWLQEGKGTNVGQDQSHIEDQGCAQCLKCQDMNV